jgi:flagellar basal body-associated protein FliL
MNKKKLIILLFILIIILLITGGFYYKFYYSSQVILPVSKVQPISVIEEYAVWTDPADFSFQYPKNLDINNHEEDQTNYAHLELTSKTHSGNLIVWVKDTNAQDIETWIKMSKINDSLDSDLGGERAKKILSGDDPKQLTIAAIYIWLNQN